MCIAREIIISTTFSKNFSTVIAHNSVDIFEAEYSQAAWIFFFVFIHTSDMEKRYTNFGQNGGEIWSWSGRKRKTFSKNVCSSVCPSAKFVCTKTWERIKMIACGFFCLKSTYRELKFPNSRSHEDLTTFLYLGIRSMKSIRFYFIDMD